MILLLLEVGLEMDLGELASVGRASLLVALVGVTIPMAGGIGVGIALGMTGKEAVFVGAALTATSVGITARVFGDLRALASVEAKTVLGAAVADDILGLVILTVVTRIVTEGSVSPVGIAWVVLVAVGFVVLATAIGVRVVPQLFLMIRRYSRSAGTLVVLALAFTLAVSELANAARLAPIVGAFVAGIALSRSVTVDHVRNELAPVAHLLVPVFFLQIGIDTEIHEFVRIGALRLAGALLVVAVLGKLGSVLGLLGSPGDRLLVGIGMIPRGEVGLIFATLGLRQHVFGQDTYAALLLVVLLTTIGTPPALRWRLLVLRERRRAEQRSSATPGPATVHVGASGAIDLDGEPESADALRIALRAARLCAVHPPGAELLDWIDRFPGGPRRWDPAALEEFWLLLDESTARAWRFLSSSVVLQRALPELDEALVSRARGGIDVDPLTSLEFVRLDRVRDRMKPREPRAFDHHLLLAALVLDVTDTTAVSPVALAQRIVARLGVGAEFDETLAGLVGDANLMIGAARRLDGLGEDAVLQLSVHLGDIERTDALYQLTLACAPDDRVLRERIDELYRLVRRVLGHPELVGREAVGETERRKSEAAALASNDTVRARIERAPRGYVLSHKPVDLARHAAMCEPRPGPEEIRVAIAREGGEFVVDVVARDRVGLIAAATSALFRMGCAVAHASAATWSDGIAVSSYRVRRARRGRRGRRRQGRLVRSERAVGGAPARTDRRPRGRVRQRRLALVHDLQRGRSRPSRAALRAHGCVRGSRCQRARGARRDRRTHRARHLRSHGSERREARRACNGRGLTGARRRDRAEPPPVPTPSSSRASTFPSQPVAAARPAMIVSRLARNCASLTKPEICSASGAVASPAGPRYPDAWRACSSMQKPSVKMCTVVYARTASASVNPARTNTLFAAARRNSAAADRTGRRANTPTTNGSARSSDRIRSASSRR